MPFHLQPSLRLYRS
ncbi:hypothetical protein LINPERHAP1_LOCUS34218 [Linum perenne]